MDNSPQSLLPWSNIEGNLHTLQEVAGGYSHAHRGIITLPNSTRVFVKIGVDTTTKAWANKEIETYHILNSCGYSYAPTLMAVNADKTAFAIQALSADEHWDWTDNWSEERLAATIGAMDSLARISLSADQRDFFAITTVSESQDGWRQLVANTDAQHILNEKLRHARREDIEAALDIHSAAKQSQSFKFARDTLVHNDVRADNCAWNPLYGQVRLVDWNWTQLGDKRIDIGAFLVNVQKAGLDVTKKHADHLDKDALHWLAGYWLNAATQPLWPGAPEKSTLRDYQLSAGITALDLARTLSTR